MPTKKPSKKIVLGEKGSRETLLKKVRKKDLGYQIDRIKQSNWTRIKNHNHEIRRLNNDIWEFRKEIRYHNSLNLKWLSDQVRRSFTVDKLSTKIKTLDRWIKHLKADIKYLSNQLEMLDIGEKEQ